MTTVTSTVLNTGTITVTDRTPVTVTTPMHMAERAAKDQPGRHDEHYYGAPTPAASVGSGARAVPASQGSRSFAKGLARRRPL